MTIKQGIVAVPEVGITAQTTTRTWEIKTLSLFVGCLALWGVAITFSWSVSPLLSMVLTVFALVLHASLTHEILHGHPFANRRLNDAMAMPQLGLFIPYLRFRDLHLAHHCDAQLTDPYDDPETNYLDPAVWNNLPVWRKVILRVNNTLLGRMAFGPFLSQHAFMRDDLRAIGAGDKAVLLGWLLHIPGLVLVVALIWAAPIPIWAYLLAVYIAMAVLRIRTFLEHRAHDRVSGRTVIIEDGGVLAFLFLNNNLHVVHHMHPSVAWHKLPALYRSQKVRFQTRNDGYIYRSYAEIFRLYFWRAKDPVAHPLWQRDKN